MSTANDFDYYYGKQTAQFQFYILPKIIMDDVRFDSISIEAKVLYCMMLDRASLSYQNKWIDNNGRVYIIFTLDAIQLALKCGKNKASKLLKELDISTGIGLIERNKNTGMGKPDTIYVKNFMSGVSVKQENLSKSDTKSNPNKFENQTYVDNDANNYDVAEIIVINKNVNKEEVANIDCGNNVNNYVDKKDINYENVNSVDNSGVIHTIEDTESPKSNPIGLKNNPKRFENQTYGGLKSKPIESLKSNPNNTNYNNTDISNTDSSQFNSVDEFSVRIELNGIENDNKSISEIQKEVLADFTEEQTLPYIYTDVKYRRHLKQAIQFLSEYNNYKKAVTNMDYTVEEREQCKEHFSLVHIFSEALVRMLSTDGNQNISGRSISYSKVYDSLVHYVKFTTLIDSDTDEIRERWLVRDLMGSAIGNYKNASIINEIKYPVPYMMTCIWTAMENGDARTYDSMRYDFQ